MISFYKKPMSGFCTTDALEHSVESFRDLVKFLLSVLFLENAAELALVFIIGSPEKVSSRAGDIP